MDPTLHVFHWDPKFFQSFQSFLMNRYGVERNPVLLEGAPPDIKLPEGVLRLNERSRFTKVRHYWSSLEATPRTILHGAFDADLRVALAARPDLAARCWWVPWGGDLYWAAGRAKTVKSWLHRAMFKTAVRRFPHLLTYMPADAELARNALGFRGTRLPCLMYDSNVVSDQISNMPLRAHAETVQPLRVFVGNSATPSSHHYDAFHTLEPLRDRDVRVYCALNYGDPLYRDSVIARGRELFGAKFKPLTAWMPRARFEELLGTMDVGVFAHHRQQGMGTTIGLLGLGKRVVLRTGTSQAKYFAGIGVQFTTLDTPNFSPMSATEADQNRRLMLEHHGRATYERYWDAVLC